MRAKGGLGRTAGGGCVGALWVASVCASAGCIDSAGTNSGGAGASPSASAAAQPMGPPGGFQLNPIAARAVRTQMLRDGQQRLRAPASAVPVVAPQPAPVVVVAPGASARPSAPAVTAPAR